MASVVGLLEEREPAAREGVEGLREEADRVLAALAEAETDWQEWLITRQRVGAVLSAPRPVEAGLESPAPAEEPCVSESVSVPDAPAAVPSRVARAGSVVPVWRARVVGGNVLALDYRRILSVLAERRSDRDRVMTCQEIVAALGLAPVPASVEGVRSKMKRLADRGWVVDPTPGRFTLAAGCGGDQHGQQQAEAVDHDVALATGDLLRTVVSA